MVTKDDLIYELENEIGRFATPLIETPDESNLKRFRAMTVIKSELESLPLTDEQVEMLMSFYKPLQNIEAFWTNPMRQNGDKNVSEVVADYLMEGLSKYRCSKLHNNAMIEHENYFARIKKLPPQQIIEVAYEMVLKDEILSILADLNHSMDGRTVEILLSTQNPIDSIYQEWLGGNQPLRDMLKSTMASFVEQSENKLLRDYQNGAELPEYLVKRFDDMVLDNSDYELTEGFEP